MVKSWAVVWLTGPVAVINEIITAVNRVSFVMFSG